MSVEQSVREQATIDVENIGGIADTTVTFSPGVTILAGRNATNRTSLLQAVMAACGSENVSVKGDAEEGHVELSIGDETYTRTLRRENDTIVASGDPYLEDSTLADLFAFLVESNEARRAVERSDDLRDLIMRPVDTEEIQAEIDRLVEQRRDLEEELEEIESLKDRLPDLEERRTELEAQIEEKREELEETEARLEEFDADVEETREERDEVEEKLDELRDKRSTLEDVRYDVDTERESLDALREEKRELEDEREDLPDAPVGDIDEIDQQIDRLRSQKQQLESEVNELQSIIQFNEEMLEEESHDALDALAEEGDGAVTDQLVEDTTVTCWTCGSEVETDQIRTTVDHLRELNSEKLGEVTDLQDELDELKSERNTLEEKQRERERIERRLTRVENEIDDREATIEELQERREELTDEISEIEAEVEALEDDAATEVLDIHKEANQIEYDLGRLENDLDRVEDEIADVESRLDERDDIERRRDEIQEEVEDLRTKIERIEQDAVEEFNDHMDTILDILDYENLDRIWLERTQQEVREGRRKVTKSVFTLHVIRTTASGTTYEDTVDHLSESEREVTGLVFALAGYLAHDVHEAVPFILLDSLEAIDAERIATLVDYFAEYADYLVVALLPEDASALDDDYQRVTEI